MNPVDDLRDGVILLLAAGLAFFQSAHTPSQAFDAAEAFVAEAEKRYGKIEEKPEEKPPAIRKT